MNLRVINVCVSKVTVRGVALGRDINVTAVNIVKYCWRFVKVATFSKRIRDVRPLRVSLVIYFPLTI